MFPVEERLAAIASSLRQNRDVVLTAPPGSGKTTCVPAALLGEPWLKGKKIVMLEPRRLAARTCAQYIARKRGEAVGETIGYQVRLERKISMRTRLEIVTEGLLTQRILNDPELADVGLVIFDEFHERSLACDLAFSLALEIRRALRPDLRLLVMSATMAADDVARHLGDADVIRAEGRMFPVSTVYLGETSMAAAIAKAVGETSGDILCFLPGEGEIRRTAEGVCAAVRSAAEILPLYGALPKEEQDCIFVPSSRRKVILATSIAETSITLPGIACVIDSGLMRVPRFSPSTGMSGLVTLPLTQDRAEQRKGRAGRVQAGVCYRLWAEGQQQSRPAHMMPEILEVDLCSLVLTSAAWGALGREDLPWLTPPAESLWSQATRVLRLLGALDGDGRLTAKGERMARLPMHPRLANMVLNGGDPIWAALIEEGAAGRETDIRYVPKNPRVKQLARRFEVAAVDATMSPGAALALAYPDRIARNRGNGTFRMVNGRGAFLPQDDPLAHEPYLVCCTLDDRPGDAKIFLAAPIGESEIERLFGDRMTETSSCAWDRRTDAVKSVVRRQLGEMVLAEKPSTKAGDPIPALLDGIRLKGAENLPCWTKDARLLSERINFVARHEPSWPKIDEAALLGALPGFLSGLMRWRDLEKVDLFAVMDTILMGAGHDRRELERLAPSRLEVPSGSHMIVHYGGEEPTVEVRLQECFGLMATPTVLNGKVPVVMTLLSPAQRPIQVTKDLAGFWRGAYQLVRKDMRGRYPKHYWPEDPFTATATRRVRPA